MLNTILGYFVALIAGAVVAVSCRYYTASAVNIRIRNWAVSHQQAVDVLQSQLLIKRQQIQSQQEKLNKGSAIVETVGPAVVADIQALAEKGNNPRLRDLLQKRAQGEPAFGSPVRGESQGAARKGGG